MSDQRPTNLPPLAAAQLAEGSLVWRVGKLWKVINGERREAKEFTCKSGHTTIVHRVPSGKWANCSECVKARQLARYHADRSESRARNRERYAVRRELLKGDTEEKPTRREYQRAWREANRERIREYQRAYRARKKTERRA